MPGPGAARWAVGSKRAGASVGAAAGGRDGAGDDDDDEPDAPSAAPAAGGGGFTSAHSVLVANCARKGTALPAGVSGQVRCGRLQGRAGGARLAAVGPHVTRAGAAALAGASRRAEPGSQAAAHGCRGARARWPQLLPSQAARRRRGRWRRWTAAVCAKGRGCHVGQGRRQGGSGRGRGGGVALAAPAAGDARGAQHAGCGRSATLGCLKRWRAPSRPRRGPPCDRHRRRGRAGGAGAAHPAGAQAGGGRAARGGWGWGASPRTRAAAGPRALACPVGHRQVLDSGGGVGWADIAGLHEAKQLVHEIVVWPSLAPQLCTVGGKGRGAAGGPRAARQELRQEPAAAAGSSGLTRWHPWAGRTAAAAGRAALRAARHRCGTARGCGSARRPRHACDGPAPSPPVWAVAPQARRSSARPWPPTSPPPSSPSRPPR